MALDIPPSNLNEVKKLLDDPNCDCYMIVGTESGLAWEIAMALEIDMPPLKAIRIQSRDDAAEWLQGHPDAVGIAFGYGTIPKFYLTKTEAENKKYVADKIEEAQD